MKHITVTGKDLDYTANIRAEFYETREEYERAVGYKPIKRVWAQEFERGTRFLFAPGWTSAELCQAVFCVGAMCKDPSMFTLFHEAVGKLVKRMQKEGLSPHE